MTENKSDSHSEKKRGMIRRYLSGRKNRRKWYSITMSVAAIVVLVTVYMLILPAITMERQTICGLEEHVHDESCYAVEEDLFSDETTATDEYGNLIEPADETTATDESGNPIEAADGTTAADESGDLTETTSETTATDEMGNLIEPSEETASMQEEDLSEDAASLSEENRVLTCGKIEHTHTDDCYPSEEDQTDEEVLEGQIAVEDGEASGETENVEDGEASEKTDGVEDGEASEETASPTTTRRRAAARASSAGEDTSAAEAATASSKREERAANDFILTDEGENSYITGTTLSYQCSHETPAVTSWTAVTDEVTLHGDDSLKLAIEFAGVPIAAIKTSDYKLYYPLPDWMQEADGTQTITLLDNQSKVSGTLTAENGYLIATYDKTWMDSQIGTTMDGTFSMEANFSVDYVTSSVLTIGNLTIHVDYEEGKWASQYAYLDITKSEAQYIEQEDDRDILQYTLTVTSGGSVMENVRVEDGFTTSNVQAAVEEIVGVTSTASTITNTTDGLKETSTMDTYTPGTISYTGGILTWNIGDMKVNEVRTLTYQVRLKSVYTGRHRSSALSFVNVAKVYSGEYQRDTDTTTFKACGYVPPYKGQLSYEPDDDGIGGTITYWIRMDSNKDNTYVVDNLKIYDYLITGIIDVTLDTDSFYLYEGAADTVAKRANLKKQGLETKVSSEDITVELSNGMFSSFTYYIGDFKPGETKTLVYSMHINDSLYVKNNGSFKIRNRVTTYEDDTKNTVTPSKKETGTVGAFYVDSTITYSKWDQKLQGVQEKKSKTISMDGTVYQMTNSTTSEVTDVSSFAIGAGNYKFTVVVNQNGDLDVNSVDLKDSLGSYMKYTGYLQVDAYDTLKAETLTQIGNGDISEDRKKTAWLDISGNTSFTFKPSQLGFSGNNAFVLTYYTELINTGDNLTVNTNNSFTMSGTAYGSGGSPYVISNMGISVTTQAVVSSYFQASKTGWYYEYPMEDDTSVWGKGALYWMIKISGTEIPESTVFKDKLLLVERQRLYNPDSMVGVYYVDTNASFSDVKELNSTATLVDSSNYTLQWSQASTLLTSVDQGYDELNISFDHSVVIPDGKMIYIVIKSGLILMPDQNEALIYKNELYQKTGSKSFQKTGNTIQYTVDRRKATSSKQITSGGGIFVYDGSKYWNLSDLTTQNTNGTWGNFMNSTKTKQLLDPGTYIEYQICADKDGRLNGDITLSDTIPEGLEIAILRNQWFHGGSFTPTADNVEIEELENDPDWTRFTEPNKKDSGAVSSMIYYYNSKTREVRWKLANAKASSGGVFDFQLVLKVVDPDVLLGVKTGSYTNSLKVYQDDNRFVETQTAATATIYRKNLSKEIDGDSHGSIIPFKIVVNEMSEDLLEGTETITLVDELSSDLVLDISSVKVTNKNGVELTDIPMSLKTSGDITYFRLTIPDNEKLTITYEATVNAMPDKTVSISNVAHWEGYSAMPGTTVENKSFSYSLVGTISVSGHASLKLTKRDADNIMKTLEGATYTMQQAIYHDDGTYTLTGDVHTATTDQNGELYFSTDDYWMEYNKIYCLTEISAPEGYVVDPTPHYIVLATKDDTTEYPEEIQVRRNMIQFPLELVDDPEPVLYNLPETGGTGTLPIQMAGFFFLTVAAAGYVTMRKRR